MGFFDKLNKSKGGYIFLSHSHDDIDIIRKIRNTLEQERFEPLCFYLKCLSDDSEIEDLIKREIDAREWFIFANSENSRKSKWVTLEREYITRTNSKKIITIDLDDQKDITDVINGILHNLRIFISYGYKDIQIAKRIADKLKEKDYLVFIAPESIPVGSNYREIIPAAINEASQEGCVLALLSAASINSALVTKEIEYAICKGGNVIPVFLGDFELPIVLQFYLSRIQAYRLSENPTDEEIDRMIDAIGRVFSHKQ